MQEQREGGVVFLRKDGGGEVAKSARERLAQVQAKICALSAQGFTGTLQINFEFTEGGVRKAMAVQTEALR